MFPNGFFLNRDSRRILESVKSELEKGSYRDPELNPSDIDELLDLHEQGEPPERLEKIDEFLGKESNHTLCQRLKDAREKQVEIKKRLEQIHNQCYTNPDIPDTFRKNYTDGLNDSFNVRVFTPISRNMPTCEVPDFFEPFGVPTDAFERYEELSAALKVIHPDRFEQYKNFYGRVVNIGDTSLQDLKNVDELNESDHYIEREFGEGQTYIDTRVQNEKNIREKFQRDWDGTFTEGVACSSDFKYKLRSRLKEVMLDDDVDIITLYTGFLSDHTLRKFVITYFTEIVFDITRDLSGKEVRNLDKAFFSSMIEAQEVIEVSSDDNKLTSADRVFNRYIWDRLDDARHENFHFFFDTKPTRTHDNLLSLVPRRVVTQMNKEDIESWYKSDKQKLLKNKVFDSDGYTKMDGNYPEFGTGFLYDDEVVEWEDKYGRKRYGNRLPCPRMCVHDPVDEFSNDNWSFFTEELGFDSMRFEPFQEALFKQDWEKNAEPYVEESKRKEREKQKEKEQEEQDKKKYLVATVREKLRRKVREKGDIPSSWTSMAEEILDELHEEGMAQEWNAVRNVMDHTKDLRDDLEENFNKTGSSDVEVEEVAEELKTLERNGKPAFVYGPKSKSDKEILAKQHILKNYDVDEAVAEDKAEEAVSIALMDLKLEGIIDDSYHPVDEYEDPEEYKTVMSMGRGGDSSQDSDDDDESEAPGEEWMCTCGKLNGPECSVCQNPKCLKEYDEVSGEDSD